MNARSRAFESTATALSQERPRETMERSPPRGAGAVAAASGAGGLAEQAARRISAAAARIARMLPQHVAHFLLRPHVERADRTDGDVQRVADFIVAAPFDGDELTERASAG